MLPACMLAPSDGVEQMLNHATRILITPLPLSSQELKVAHNGLQIAVFDILLQLHQ